jgi:hypothetical protein
MAFVSIHVNVGYTFKWVVNVIANLILSNTRDGHMQVGNTKNNYLRCNETREYISIKNARHQN